MLQTLRDNWKLSAAAVALIAVIVATLCWQLWAPAPPKPEVYAAPTVQRDGSVLLEKKPDPAAKPKQVIPKDATAERVMQITVQPTATYTATERTQVGKFGNSSTAKGAILPCPPVTVDLTLIRESNGLRRVAASSPDGQVVGGMDIPLEETAPPPAPKVWAAGIAGDLIRRTAGVWVDRDLGPFRFGAQLNQRDLGGLPTEPWIKVGIKF